MNSFIAGLGVAPVTVHQNHAIFYGILKELFDHGQDCAPRGLPCKELRDYRYTLPPRVRFMCFDHRKLNLDYVKQEFLWYLRGDRRDVSIKRIASTWEGLVNPDGTLNSNYGYYIFNPEAGKNYRPNFYRVVDELARDPDSRRAAICILDNDHLNSQTRDYPCTSYLNFHVRDNKLHAYVRMRSQDAIYGMGNDAPFFSFVHELMWSELIPYYSDLELGDYHHSADSFHVYERHYEMLAKILVDPTATVDHHLDCPPMCGLALPSLRTLAVYPDRISTFSAFEQWLVARKDPATLLGAERAFT